MAKIHLNSDHIWKFFF